MKSQQMKTKSLLLLKHLSCLEIMSISCSSFNSTNHYQHIAEGPIKESTVLTLDPKTGKVLGRWGDNFFYLPHGLTIDRHDNLWITDVGMHQGFKVRQ